MWTVKRHVGTAWSTTASTTAISTSHVRGILLPHKRLPRAADGRTRPAGEWPAGADPRFDSRAAGCGCRSTRTGSSTARRGLRPVVKALSRGEPAIRSQSRSHRGHPKTTPLAVRRDLARRRRVRDCGRRVRLGPKGTTSSCGSRVAAGETRYGRRSPQPHHR